MNPGDWVPWISPVVTLLIGVLVYLNARRQNRTSEKKLSIEEQQVEDEREDGIAERRRVELERLYTRVEKLEATVAALEKADVAKQTTINDQAAELGRTKDELVRTNQLLTDVRALVVKFTARVEDAWKNDHPMPTLTVDELALLEDTIPKSTFLTRGETS